MELIQCNVCDKEMASRAKTCPNCGAPNLLIKQENKKTIRAIVITTLTLAIILILFLLISNKRPNMDERVYKLGVKAIEHTDDYLDGKLSNDDAELKLERIHNQLEEIDNHDSFILSSDVFILKLKISSIDGMYSDTTTNDIVAKRNDLADRLNVKKR